MKKAELLSLLFDGHTEIEEKTTMLNRYLEVFSQKDIWADSKTIIDYFNGSLVDHFRREEVLIKAMLKNQGLSAEAAANFMALLSEHQSLMKQFARLKILSEKIIDGEMELQNDFINACFNANKVLVAHAKNEDNLLYELAETIISEKEMIDINNELKKLK